MCNGSECRGAARRLARDAKPYARDPRSRHGGATGQAGPRRLAGRTRHGRRCGQHGAIRCCGCRRPMPMPAMKSRSNLSSQPKPSKASPPVPTRPERATSRAAPMARLRQLQQTPAQLRFKFLWDRRSTQSSRCWERPREFSTWVPKIYTYPDIENHLQQRTRERRPMTAMPRALQEG